VDTPYLLLISCLLFINSDLIKTRRRQEGEKNEKKRFMFATRVVGSLELEPLELRKKGKIAG
jgi:hypothetical protein